MTSLRAKQQITIYRDDISVNRKICLLTKIENICYILFQTATPVKMGRGVIEEKTMDRGQGMIRVTRSHIHRSQDKLIEGQNQEKVTTVKEKR